ncbi:hypothetical protein [Listeria rustica]|uniref:DUF4397 domain-containing protein n=1 Tax=Listeria rustica TaxID=2713503 RepID=A0A7W1T7G3_9LIST|nr:hypothetical protein [Listeria rustica]MBA3926902.1 hypothetical protein [Listeria rustica]
MKKKITGTLLIVGMSVLSLGGLLQNGQEVQATSAIGILPPPTNSQKQPATPSTSEQPSYSSPSGSAIGNLPPLTSPEQPTTPPTSNLAEQLSVRSIDLNEEKITFNITANTREFTVYINNQKIGTRTVNAYQYLVYGQQYSQIITNLNLKVGDTVRIDSKDHNNISYTGKTFKIDENTPLVRTLSIETAYAGATQFTINTSESAPYMRIFVNGNEVSARGLAFHTAPRLERDRYTIPTLSTPLKKGDKLHVIAYSMYNYQETEEATFTTFVK